MTVPFAYLVVHDEIIVLTIVDGTWPARFATLASLEIGDADGIIDPNFGRVESDYAARHYFTLEVTSPPVGRDSSQAAMASRL